MRNILTIAKWEVLRLRTRFNGKSKAVIIPVIILAIALSFTIYHQNFSLNKGIYTIGIAPGSPIITDSRFNCVTVDSQQGAAGLYEGTLDLYLHNSIVETRSDERSQYAAGALKKYLENLEIERISTQYPLDKAFPLRVTIAYLYTAEKSSPSLARVDSSTLPDPVIIESSEDDSLVISSNEMTQDNPPQGSIAEWFDPEADTQALSTGQQTQVIDSTKNSRETASLPGDSSVQQQLEQFQKGGSLPEFKAQFVSENQVIVPSLMNPPMPLAQVVIAFLYIIPMFFISVFFTSSFASEKVNHKLVILLSSPVTRMQVILGKMLPYYCYSILMITGVTLFLHGNIGLALAIFFPVMLFVFSIYLIVALTYRTFKDQTFFSVVALSAITVYLIVPAMFAGVSDLSYISPLTLAVQMYRGESFSITQYLIATLPLYLTFVLVMYVGRRVFNEEFLMGFKPLHNKVTDALFLSLNLGHLKISLFVLSILLIPIVFAVQLVAIVIVSNLPMAAVLWGILLFSVVIEEIAKSIGIYTLIKNKVVSSKLSILKLSLVSALGFWVGEKLLLVLASQMSAESGLVNVFLGSGISSGWLFFLPLALHTLSTFVVCMMASHNHKRSYVIGLVCGTVIHAVYNIGVLLATGVFK